MQKNFLFFIWLLLIALSCSEGQNQTKDEYYDQRKSMVEHQLKGRGIRNKKVLKAMMTIPRQKYVPDKYKHFAYSDSPIPIEYNQSISQPYIVAYMTEKLDPRSDQKILEIGTGSGYQAAILSLLYKEVYTIEIIKPLGEKAEKIFREQGYDNIKVKIGDGYEGWKEYAPFDAIIVTCAPENVPQPLIDQLAEGGKMIIPVGSVYSQVLYLLEKRNGKIQTTAKLPVLFVPMTREK